MDSTTFFVTILVAVFGSNGLFLLLQFLIQRKDNKYVRVADLEPIKESIERLENNNKATLKDRLHQMMKHNLAVGEITSDELECINDLMVEYESLGGNGFIHTLYEKVKKLPIK